MLDSLTFQGFKKTHNFLWYVCFFLNAVFVEIVIFVTYDSLLRAINKYIIMNEFIYL
jgi:hypothetical protein